jgi:hypothetical protein
MKDLAVRQLTLQSDGKPDQQIEGIMQEFPSVHNYVQMVVDIINKKSARIQDYIQGLTHVNLIIRDTGHRLLMLPRSDFYRIFFTPSLRTTLSASEFREIFYVTTLEKDVDRWVYIPLKALLMLSQLYIFDSALQRYYSHLNVESPREELSLFAHYLHHIGTKGIYISDKAGEFEVICGKYGVMITDQKSLIVRDYGDYLLPESVIPFTVTDEGAFIDGAFEEKINEFAHDNTFVCGLVFDVNKPS